MLDFGSVNLGCAAAACAASGHGAKGGGAASRKCWLCNVRRARLRSTRGSLFLAPLVDRRGGGWLLEFRFSIHFCTARVAVRQQRAFFKFLSLLAPAIGQITTDPPGALSPRS